METSRFFLDSVVTVVDAAHVIAIASSGPFAARRRAEVPAIAADCIVLNKIDYSPHRKRVQVAGCRGRRGGADRARYAWHQCERGACAGDARRVSSRSL